MKRVIYSDSKLSFAEKAELSDEARITNNMAVLLKCANNDDWYLRAAVASNPNLPVDLIVKLADDSDYLVRGAAYSNPSIPSQELISRLADEDVMDVRSRATHSSDPAVLAFLADDRSPEIRYWVAINKNTPKEVLEKLAKDNTTVRLRIGDRANVAKGAQNTLSKLAGDSPAGSTSRDWPNANYWNEDVDDEELYDTYLADPEEEVNAKLKILVESSTQSGIGKIFIYDESGKNRFDMFSIDYEDWCDDEFNMASSSKSATEYAKKYEKYIKRLIANQS